MIIKKKLINKLKKKLRRIHCAIIKYFEHHQNHTQQHPGEKGTGFRHAPRTRSFTANKNPYMTTTWTVLGFTTQSSTNSLLLFDKGECKLFVSVPGSKVCRPQTDAVNFPAAIVENF